MLRERAHSEPCRGLEDLPGPISPQKYNFERETPPTPPSFGLLDPGKEVRRGSKGSNRSNRSNDSPQKERRRRSLSGPGSDSSLFSHFSDKDGIAILAGRGVDESDPTPATPSALSHWIGELFESDRVAMEQRHRAMLSSFVDQLGAGKDSGPCTEGRSSWFLPKIQQNLSMALSECADSSNGHHADFGDKPDRKTLTTAGTFDFLECESQADVSFEYKKPAPHEPALEAITEQEGLARDCSSATVLVPKQRDASHRARVSSFRADDQQGLSWTSFREQNNVQADGPGFFTFLRFLVQSPKFEALFVFLITLNAVSMAVESQYNGLLAGSMIGYTGYPELVEKRFWPGAPIAFMYLEWVFGIVFFMEVALKIFTLRREFCQCPWNWLDAFCVFSWIVAITGEVSFFISPMIMRVMRLMRLLRLLRLVRTIKGFDSLFLMTTAMKSSLSVLMWSITLLVLLLSMCSLLIQSTTETYITNEANEHWRRLEVFRFYGTFARSMLTMFEMTVGNWMPPCRALVENISEWYLLFSLTHKMVIGFAVVCVLNGVFIQETFKVAESDDHVMMLHKERAMRTHSAKMQLLFEHADGNGDGSLTLEEFSEVVEDPAVRTWLASMELDVQDVKQVFKLLDDGDGALTALELVAGVSRLKGVARSIDVAMILQELKRASRLNKRVYKLLHETERRHQSAIAEAPVQEPFRSMGASTGSHGDSRGPLTL